MERYVTIPIEIAIASTPGLMRSNTVYALSFIRLSSNTAAITTSSGSRRSIEEVLHADVQPVISPPVASARSSATSSRVPEIDVMQLKTLQDWVVERRLRIVPGVADVLVLGGKTNFQAEIDLNRMIAHGGLPQIISAMSAGNSNVGGRTMPWASSR